MKRRLVIFETHPIQYRAPVYQALQALSPDTFEVVYASDFSVRGYRDEGFGEKFSWDIPLLEGYNYRVLGNEVGNGIREKRGLTAKGVDQAIRQLQPSAVLLHSLGYEFSWAAFAHAWRRRIPVWLRTETQDESFERGFLKGLGRNLAYRTAYLGVSRAFYIGELNKLHYLRHGLPPRALLPARYCTPDKIKGLTEDERAWLRTELRRQFGIEDDVRVVAFFGKLIEKKDPGLLFSALSLLGGRGRSRYACMIVGSGALESDLRRRAQELLASRGIPTFFAGFINQSKLPQYYLAADIAVLPSRRMGETWGLVVNEALQAGCSAVVSNAVGCHADFDGWERFRTIPIGDAAALAASIAELAMHTKSFRWAEGLLADYSVDAAARALQRAIESLDPAPKVD